MVNRPQVIIYFKTVQFIGFETRRSIFENFVTPGDWAYAASDDLTPGTKGAYVLYTDKDDNTYSSFGAQDGSTFTVISVTPIPTELGIYEPRVRIKLKFSCKLYPTAGNGAPITITDAEAVILLKDWVAV